MSFLADRLLPSVVNMSLTAGVIILIVLAARLLLKRAPRAFSYALWAVVLFRLLCPVSFSSGLSFLGAVDAPAEFALSGQISAISYVGADFRLASPASAAAVDSEAAPEPDTGAPGMPVSAPEREPAADVNVPALLWAGAASAMLLRGAVLYLDLKMRLWRAPKLSGNVYGAKGVDTAFVAGALRPKIYLPEGLDERERECVLAHELCHIRRGDHIIKPLAYIALCLHWFNPLVWLAWVLAMRDMESSCDEAAIKRLHGASRADYAQTLLNLATGRRGGFNAALAFGDDTKRRIKEVARLKPVKKWAGVLAAALAVTVIAGCAANPTRKKYDSVVEYTSQVPVQSPAEYVTLSGDTAEAGWISAYQPGPRLVASVPLSDGTNLEAYTFEWMVTLDLEGKPLSAEAGSSDGNSYDVCQRHLVYAKVDGNGKCEVLLDRDVSDSELPGVESAMCAWYADEYGVELPKPEPGAALGQYTGIDEYANGRMSGETEMEYMGTDMTHHTAQVLGRMAYVRSDPIILYFPEGELEVWNYAAYYLLDVEPGSVAFVGDNGAYSSSQAYMEADTNWYNFDGGRVALAVKRADGTYDVLRDISALDYGRDRYYMPAEALEDWYITDRGLDVPLNVVDWSDTLGSVEPAYAGLVRGDGWYCYVLRDGWDYEGSFRWSSESGSGAYFSVQRLDADGEGSGPDAAASAYSRTADYSIGGRNYRVTMCCPEGSGEELAELELMFESFTVGDTFPIQSRVTSAQE